MLKCSLKAELKHLATTGERRNTARRLRMRSFRSDLPPVFHPVASAFYGHHVAVVQQPIQYGAGDGAVVVEYFRFFSVFCKNNEKELKSW